MNCKRNDDFVFNAKKTFSREKARKITFFEINLQELTFVIKLVIK